MEVCSVLEHKRKKKKKGNRKDTFLFDRNSLTNKNY